MKSLTESIYEHVSYIDYTHGKYPKVDTVHTIQNVDMRKVEKILKDTNFYKKIANKHGAKEKDVSRIANVLWETISDPDWWWNYENEDDNSPKIIKGIPVWDWNHAIAYLYDVWAEDLSEKDWGLSDIEYRLRDNIIYELTKAIDLWK